MQNKCPCCLQPWKFPAPSFTLAGKVPSKKNAYRPRAGGFYKDAALRDALDMLTNQLPRNLTDKQLEHPFLMAQFNMPKKSWGTDRDNKLTTLLDIMVSGGVIKDDRINAFNEALVVLPTEVTSDYETKVWIGDGR